MRSAIPTGPGSAIAVLVRDIAHMRRRALYGHRELGLILLVTGFAAGILTDLVVAYGGV